MEILFRFSDGREGHLKVSPHVRVLRLGCGCSFHKVVGEVKDRELPSGDGESLMDAAERVLATAVGAVLSHMVPGNVSACSEEHSRIIEQIPVSDLSLLVDVVTEGAEEKDGVRGVHFTKETAESLPRAIEELKKSLREKKDAIQEDDHQK